MRFLLGLNRRLVNVYYTELRYLLLFGLIDHLTDVFFIIGVIELQTAFVDVESVTVLEVHKFMVDLV